MKILFKCIFVIFGKKKISYENWIAAYQKWKKIVELTQNNHSFVDFNGFEDHPVWEACGYCLDSNKYIRKCFMCYLNNELSKDGKVICHKYPYESSVVLTYIRLMRGVSFKDYSEKAREDALDHGRTILKVIEEHGKSMGYEIPKDK
ncbi:hypothetical protein ACFL16_00400 [Patescibacteria group bacterium]